MSIKSIIVVSTNYPSDAQPTHGTFVQQIAHAIADLGITCTVIAPVAIHRSLNGSYAQMSTEGTSGGEKVLVYRPRFLSLSARKSFSKLGLFNPSRLTFRIFMQATMRIITKHCIQADVMYGHFLFSAGGTVIKLGFGNGIPAFVGVGEGEFWTVDQMGIKFSRKILKHAKGFIANSNDIKVNLIDLLETDSIPIGVFPNGVNIDKFRPMDKQVCRKKMGLPGNKFIVGGVGNYTHNKGIARIAKAIEGKEGTVGAFAGSGSEAPEGEHVVFNKRIHHDEVPVFLSALDVFVLPTLVEGCSNAIIEAMACGLPIISSNYSFNKGILDDSMSFAIDPLNLNEIGEKIELLRTNENLCKRMSEAALFRSVRFDIRQRAQRIVRFMEKNIDLKNTNS